MSISPLSNYSALQTGSGSSRRQDFLALSKALKSGNLQGAQQAFSNLQQTAGSRPVGLSPTSSISADFQALEKALSSGNLDQAQIAFTQLQSDLQAARHSVSVSGSSGSTATSIQDQRMQPGGGNAPEPVFLAPFNASATVSTPSSETSGIVDLLG